MEPGCVGQVVPRNVRVVVYLRLRDDGVAQPHGGRLLQKAVVAGFRYDVGAEPGPLEQRVDQLAAHGGVGQGRGKIVVFQLAQVDGLGGRVGRLIGVHQRVGDGQAQQQVLLAEIQVVHVLVQLGITDQDKSDVQPAVPQHVQHVLRH